MRAKFNGLLVGAASLLIAAAPAANPDYAVTGHIAAPDGGWDYASFDPVARRLFIARSDAITAIDVDTQKVTQLTTATKAHAVLLIPNTNLLAETDGTSGTLRLIDRQSGAETARIPVGEKPDAAIYDAVTKTVVVMNARSGTVSIVDPSRAAVVATITLKPGLEFAAIDDHHQLFVNNEDVNVMHVVNLTTRRVYPGIVLTGCTSPSGLAYSGVAHRLIAACANGVAAVVDPRTRRLVSLVKTGNDPDAVILDDPRGLAFIPAGGSGQLDIVKLSRDGKVTAAGHVVTASGARTGALDPATGSIYLPHARFAAPVAGQTGRPPQILGSFDVLVISPAP